MMKKSLWLVLFSVATISLTACATKGVESQPTTTTQAEGQQYLNELKQGVAIYFNKNSSEIDEQYRIYLTAASKILAQNPRFVLALEGHTDSSGSLSTNNRVSLSRANAVRAELVTQYGVSPSQLTIAGAGPAKPIASNDTADGRAKNRRVTATLKIQ